MDTDGPARLVELAGLLGESVFTAPAGPSTLSVFNGAVIGLPADARQAGAALAEGLDADDQRRLAALLGQAEAAELEVALRRPSQPIRWLQLRASAGAPDRRVGRVTDVTGRRQLERALRILHERTAALTGQAYLEAVVGALAEALGVGWTFIGQFLPGRTDALRTVALWQGGRLVENIEYELAGTPCEQVLAAQVCVIPSGVARRFPRDQMLSDLKLESYLGVRVPGPDGRPRGVLVGMDERPMAAVPEVASLLGLYAAGVAAELDRLEVERRLVESEARFRQIVTCCAEGVALVGSDGAVVYANPQLAALVGQPAAEQLVGRSFRDFTPPALHADVEQRLRSRHVGVAERYESRLLHRTGRELLVEVSAAPIAGPDGRVAGSIAVFRDVTEERAIDEQVREAQRRESLGRLAGGVAHDFNNLLVGILGNSGFAAAELPAGSDVRAAVEDIHVSARKASDLTRQLLAYSGRGAFSVGPVSLDQVVGEMARLARPSLRPGARLDLQLGGNLPDVDGDLGQLGQMVVNLLTNASDALSERGGAIRARTDLVQADQGLLSRFHGSEGLPEGTYLRLVVEDDGVGMDDDTRQRVFDPFFSTKFAGRGLGLAAALGIVKGHRGAIRVESEPGKGSCFTVLLPPGRAGRAAPDAGPARPTARSVVLVADDEEVVRRTARRALERAGHEVIEARDGHEAVEAFRVHGARVACVLLDLTMPGMGGEAALAAIRLMRADVPVVLTSGYSDRDEAPGGAGDPSVRFLPKPFGPHELVEAVEKARGGSA